MSKLVQVMAWWWQATSLYLSQCWCYMASRGHNDLSNHYNVILDLVMVKQYRTVFAFIPRRSAYKCHLWIPCGIVWRIAYVWINQLLLLISNNPIPESETLTIVIICSQSCTLTHWLQGDMAVILKVYRQVSNISRTLVGNEIVDHSDVVGASPVGAAPTTSSFST